MAYDRKSWYYRSRHCTTGRRDGSDGLVGQKPTTLRCCGPGRWSLKCGRQNTPARISVFCGQFRPTCIGGTDGCRVPKIWCLTILGRLTGLLALRGVLTYRLLPETNDQN